MFRISSWAFRGQGDQVQISKNTKCFRKNTKYTIGFAKRDKLKIIFIDIFITSRSNEFRKIMFSNQGVKESITTTFSKFGRNNTKLVTLIQGQLSFNQSRTISPKPPKMVWIGNKDYTKTEMWNSKKAWIKNFSLHE